MSGQWVYKKENAAPHNCDNGRPFPDKSKKGSVWLCECGKRYKVARSRDIFESGTVWHRYYRRAKPPKEQS